MVARCLMILGFLSILNTLSAQETDSLTADQEEVMGLISLYRYMLNTIGDKQTPVSEKETIIKNSYRKIFRDEEVQIEDDLQEGRSVILNKSVVGYLRDIDFFFQSVQFDFSDIAIDSAENEDGDTYFRVSYVCSLQAVDLEDSSINRSYQRYVEVNRTESEGLKIVSVYSSVQDPHEYLMAWWHQMDTSWQAFFLTELEIDSVDTDALTRLVNLDSLDLSRRPQTQDLSPLAELRKLMFLNLSGTKVIDLMPIRYANRLTHLDLSHTSVFDLKVFNYLPKLTYLSVKGCQLLDPNFLTLVPQLRGLDLSETAFIDFYGLKDLTYLKHLNLSTTTFENPEVLSGLSRLQRLDISSTAVSSIYFDDFLEELMWMDASNTYITEIGFIEKTPALKELAIEYTEVSDLNPVIIHPSIKKVLADFTKVAPSHVATIMNQTSDVIILTESNALKSWWEELSDSWKKGLQVKHGWKPIPTVEDLVIYLQEDSLDLSNIPIQSGDPLARFRQLVYLNLSGSNLTDLQFVDELKDLKYLEISNTDVISWEGIQHARNLEVVKLEDTPIKSLGLLGLLPNLRFIYADRSNVSIEQVEEYVRNHLEVTVIYRSSELIPWWDNLYGTIKSQLKPLMGNYSVENLHKLTTITSLDLEGFQLRFFDQIEVFHFLKSLSISGVQESILPDLKVFEQLDSLSWTRAPLVNLEPVKVISGLSYLNISNTAVDDLRPLVGLPVLEAIDCSGTQVKSLKPLKEMPQLKYLNISNTRVWQLNWLYDIRGIETLVCFNTRITERKLDQFKMQFPNCEVTNY
jgi:Leucine-rich repeat (LRR) protein